MLFKSYGMGLAQLVTLLVTAPSAWCLTDANAVAKSFRAKQAEIAPVVDGHLDDAIWREAMVIADFHQIKPGDGSEPSQRTEVQIAYDDHYIYFAGTAFESDPSLISTYVQQHGQGFPNDDRMTLVIDPYNTGRSGYRFETNAAGARHDMLYIDNDQFNSDWEAIWQTASQLTDKGWTFEMAIPFKSLSFDPNSDTWGVNFSRAIRRKDEEMVWVSRNRTFGPAIMGAMTGLNELDQGFGLDVVPSLSVGQRREYKPTDSHTIFEPSLDAYYRVTPSLNAALTINTDFSATEVDDRQVDLTRFGLFFPEKRDFFLNDADLFTFGRIISGSDEIHPRSTLENGRPFFSRRIGLGADGMPVDLVAGGKLSGRIGPWSIGTLAVRQDSYGEVNASDLLVSRIQRDVLDESTVGVIVTNGDPASNLSNSLVGADFLYNHTSGRWPVEAKAWLQQTNTEHLAGDDMAYGAGLAIPANEGIRGGVQWREIQQNFYPALGYVNRTGIRDYQADIGYKYFFGDTGLGSWFQSVYSGIDGKQIHGIDGALQSGVLVLRAMEFATNTFGKFQLRARHNEENVDVPFRIFNGKRGDVMINPDEYTFDDYSVLVGTGGFREVFGNLKYTGGEFYDGDRRGITADVTWQPSAQFSTTLKYDWNQIELPQQDFITRVAIADISYNFFLGLTWKALVQYDNLSEIVGLNSRLSWNAVAGREIFVVLNHNWQDFDRDNQFANISSDVVLKIGYTIRL